MGSIGREHLEVEIRAPNSAWGHAWVNVHAAMMMGPLHQLLKGVVKYCKIGKADSGDTVNLDEMTNTTRVDESFRSVPAYTGLNTFG